MNDRIVFLLKFGSEKNIKDLFENGTIFLNPFEKFEKDEKNNFRGDNYESLIGLENFSNPSKYRIKITDTKTGKISDHKPKKLVKLYKDLSAGNLYSMYCIKKSEINNNKKFKISIKMKEFGSHFLFIHKPMEFMKRIENTFKENQLKFNAKAVTYYDHKKFSGPLSLFHKKKEHSYQNEFRIVTRNSGSKPLKLNIGNLDNISKIR